MSVMVRGLSMAATRTRLLADRSYYVRTDGADTNSGRANTAGGAFLTIQKAVDVVADTLDLGGRTVTIQVEDGTYAGAVSVTAPFTGDGTVILLGDTTTPSNVVMTNVVPVTSSQGARLRVQGIRFAHASQVASLFAQYGGYIEFSLCEFGAVLGCHLGANYGGRIVAIGNYAITGGGQAHIHCNYKGDVAMGAVTVTITNTPAFSLGFVALRESSARTITTTFSGSATGKRFYMHYNSTLDTNNAARTYLPGDTHGIQKGGSMLDNRGVGGPFTLADDTADYIQFDTGTSPFLFAITTNTTPGSGAPSGFYHVRPANGTVVAVAVSASSSNVTLVADTVLAGTTHTDGQFNISYRTAENRLYFENRMAASRTFAVDVPVAN